MVTETFRFVRYNARMTAPDPNSPLFWNKTYHNGRIPWDLHGPTPIFRRLVQDGTLTPGRIIVLGAGRGHDARMLARHGFQVTAVDFAASAVQAMRQLDDPRYPVTIVEADLFELPFKIFGHFDLVLDYTCYCAIDPGRRDEYADVVTRLLRSEGRLVMLAFPIGRRGGGPPFVVQPNEIIAAFTMRGFHLDLHEQPGDSVPSRQGIEELLILRKQPRS